MRIRLAVPDELDDRDRKAALDAALESVTRTVSGLVRSGAVPPAAGEIKAGRVHWRPEPPGDEHFDLPGTILQRGHGDCDDLAPWHAGSLRAAGIDPGARAIVKKSGPKRWHAIVQRSDGSIEDPSAHAGMGAGVSGAYNVVGVAGAIHRPMASDNRMCLAICPSRDPRHPSVWFARLDVPDRLEEWDWSSMAADDNPRRAILRAVKTARTVAGDEMDRDDEARLAAVNDLVLGADPQDVADELDALMGEDFDLDGCMDDAVHSVGFFGDLIKAIAPVAKGFIPGASTALDFMPSVVNFVRKPSFGSAVDIATSPYKAQINLAKTAFKNPVLRPILQAGIPIAATAFGGPLGTAAGGLVTQYLSQATAPRRPGAPPPPPMPGIPPELQEAFRAFLAQQSAPRFQYERGHVARPWGRSGPAVMRF